jgi:heat shock protein HtpX
MSTMNNQLKTVLLFGVLSLVVVGLGTLVAPGKIAFFAAFALLMNLGAYFFSDRLVLTVSGARPVVEGELPQVQAALRELALAARIPEPRLFVTDDPQPNAFATGRSPAHGVVVVTRGLLASLPARELRGVIAHEIAHIKNRDILIASMAAIMASLVTSVAQAFGLSALFGSSSNDDDDSESLAGGLLLAILAPIIGSLLQFAISRQREFVADETAAKLTGDGEALASALERLEEWSAVPPPATMATATASLKIVSPFAATEAMGRLFSTHPPTEARVARLRALSFASFTTSRSFIHV